MEDVMANTTMTIRLGVEDKQIIGAYAETFGQSVSYFMRESAMRRIEDELDLVAWDEAKKEHDENPTSYSASEIVEKYL
jgi:predicted DNA-binding protein